MGTAHANDYLQGADLTGANFMGSNLQGADLRNANLQGADLTGADLTGVIGATLISSATDQELRSAMNDKC